MQRKKLFLLITKSNWGGAQRYVYDLATHLPTDHYDISVVLGAPRVDTNESGKGVLFEKLKSKGIRIIALSELKRDINFLEEVVVFWKLLRLFWRERPDIIHVNSSKIGGLGAFAGRCAFVKKIVFTVHGWPFLEDRPRLERGLIKFLSFCSVLFSHQTIVIGQSEAAIAKKFPLVRKKIHFIHNGIELHGVLSQKDTRSILTTHLHETAGITLPNSSLWIGTISELVPNKGLQYLIEAFAHFRSKTTSHDPLLFIIGGGEQKDYLQSLIQKLQLQESVYLLGFIPNADTLLPAFDVFTLTSLKEGLPYVILEAGNAGLPVLATSVGEIPNLIKHEQSGYIIAPKDSRAISEGLLYLSESQKLRNKLGATLKETLATSYSLSEMLRETMQVYSK